MYKIIVKIEEVKKYIGKQVKYYREIVKGWNQQKLAEKANVGLNVIRQIEQYKGNPTLETLYKISQALEIDITDILPQKSGVITIDIKKLEDLKK